MAKCVVCKEFIVGFEWTPTKSGKKWLADKNGNWHDCPKSQSKFVRKSLFSTPLTAKDHEYCDMCDRWLITKECNERRPEIHYISREDHNEKFHPNGEILDDIDFIVPTMIDKDNGEKETIQESRMRIRKEWNHSGRTEKYKLNGKYVS